MKKFFQTVIKTISGINFDMTKDYKLYRKINSIVSFSFSKDKYKRINTKVGFSDRKVPVSFFIDKDEIQDKLIIYFHGGGWVTGDVDTYTNACSRLAVETKCIIASVDYRLAPEYPFPHGLRDCYDVVKEFFLKDNIFGIKSDNIILMGDSAGANLAAVVSLIASEKEDFFPKKQILLYPVTYYDHSEKSPFFSVVENGEQWLLTSKRIRQYMKLYVPDKNNLKNKYVAPLLADNLKNQPKTLIITAQYDPLRDEGEAYGYKLKDFGNDVVIKRISDAIHGFFSAPLFPNPKKESLIYINNFINGSGTFEE